MDRHLCLCEPSRLLRKPTPALGGGAPPGARSAFAGIRPLAGVKQRRVRLIGTVAWHSTESSTAVARFSASHE
jgi:hypothetical protein